MEYKEEYQEEGKKTEEMGEMPNHAFAIIVKKGMGGAEEESKGGECVCPECGCKLVVKKAE
jgi:hypothetical protein